MNDGLITMKIEDASICGFVYALMPVGDLVKIGGATNFCSRPMQQFAAHKQRSMRGCPRKGVVLARYIGADYLQIEKRLLRIMNPLYANTHMNSSREVFKVTPGVKKQIEAVFKENFSDSSMDTLERMVEKLA